MQCHDPMRCYRKPLCGCQAALLSPSQVIRISSVFIIQVCTPNYASMLVCPGNVGGDRHTEKIRKPSDLLLPDWLLIRWLFSLIFCVF